MKGWCLGQVSRRVRKVSECVDQKEEFPWSPSLLLASEVNIIGWFVVEGKLVFEGWWREKGFGERREMGTKVRCSWVLALWGGCRRLVSSRV